MNHSQAYIELNRYIKANGHERLDGISNNIFEYIYPEERLDAERLVIKAFKSGYYELADLIIKLRSIDGAKLLSESLPKLSKKCDAYATVLLALYNETKSSKDFEEIKEYYLANAGSISGEMFVSKLSFNADDSSIYNLLTNIYINDTNEVCRGSAINGILFADGVIKSLYDINEHNGNIELLASFAIEEKEKRIERLKLYKQQ